MGDILAQKYGVRFLINVVFIFHVDFWYKLSQFLNIGRVILNIEWMKECSQVRQSYMYSKILCNFA